MTKKDNKKKETQDNTGLEVAKVSFSFMFTRDEAEAYIKRPRSQMARNLKKYMCSIFEAAAKKMLSTSPEEIVKGCKVDIPKHLK